MGSPGRQLRVSNGDYVKAGDALVEGPLVPHDILRVSGEEAVQQYLTREVQKVYRLQNVKINDKHIEIIVSQMLRKVCVEDVGDSGLLEGALMDKFDFFAKNKELDNCVKVTNPGDTDFTEGEIVPRERFEVRNEEALAEGRTPAEFTAPKHAVASTQLLGISKAAVQSPSFISAASFQETTKVLTEAALAGKVDHLVGLKENVILGHLIPAGTGFRLYQNSEWEQCPGATNDGPVSILDAMDGMDTPEARHALLDDSKLDLDALDALDNSEKSVDLSFFDDSDVSDGVDDSEDSDDDSSEE